MSLIVCSVYFIYRSIDRVRDLPEITKSGRIVVVTDSSNMGFALKNDSVFGFQYEIIKIFTESLGVELQISQQNDLNEALTGLRHGEFDIVASLTPQTSTTSGGVLFSKPIMSSRLMLVQPRMPDSLPGMLKKQYELAGDSIYIPSNPAYRKRLLNLCDEIGDTIFIFEVKKQTTEMLIRLVAAGKIPYTVCPEELAPKYLRMYPQLDISMPLGFTQNYGWMVNEKSTALNQKLNSFLSDFIGSSRYWALYHKYY